MGDPISITYEELLSFNPNDLEEKSSSSSAAANASSTTRVLLDKIGLAYGPQGWGILFVSGVPGCETARRALLPLAAQFARLPEREQEACVHAESLYSVGWSHGKEALARGTVDTAKGSFYAKPLLLWESDDAHQQQQQRQNALAQKHPECFAPNLWPTRALPALQPAFVTMGLLLHRVGCLLATVCDAYCLVRHGVATSIAPTLQPSLNATGRLLHYFAMNEQRQQPEDHHHHPDDETSPSSLSPLEPQAWCGWHNDHVSAPTGSGVTSLLLAR